MIVTADEERRVVLPSPTRPGDTFDLEEAGLAQFVLTRLERQTQPVRLERKGEYLVAVTDRVITQAATRTALDEFP
jgi:hypothetical protein